MTPLARADCRAGRRMRPPQLRQVSTWMAKSSLSLVATSVHLIFSLTLYLGHPSRGGAVVLGVLLLGAGLGSMRTDGLSEKSTLAALVTLARTRKLIVDVRLIRTTIRWDAQLALLCGRWCFRGTHELLPFDLGPCARCRIRWRCRVGGQRYGWYRRQRHDGRRRRSHSA